MKIVKTGTVSRIFSDDLQTFDSIPVGNYKVCFHPMMGFYLEDMDVFIAKEKTYGKHPVKIDKAIRLYNSIDRSVGIILSGKKGMGKSMFARELSSRFAIEKEMPTIIVTEAHVGIVDFIESIKQECVVLFDEFEKVFDNGSSDGLRSDKIDRNKESQDKLLGLFDGLSQTKRLYVITVNELRKVNQYMINRPGRFHYHLQFNYPSKEEIAVYLTDKLLPEYHDNIVLVQRFSNRFDLNYDSLRAIAFELNMGYSFFETMEDLNISSSEVDSIKYNVLIYYSDGHIGRNEVNVNLMSSHCSFSHYDKGCYNVVNFSPLEIDIDNKDSFTLTSDNNSFSVTSEHDDDDNEEDKLIIEKIIFNNAKVGGAGRMMYGKELEGFMGMN